MSLLIFFYYQVFTCNSDYNTDEDCTYLDSITFRMKNLHGYNQDYQHDIKFRIYSKDSGKFVLLHCIDLA